MEWTIEWNPTGNAPEVTTTGCKADQERTFVFTPVGEPGNRHVIQPYPKPGDYENSMLWTLYGPGGATGPKIWEQVSKNPPFRMVIGPSEYTEFAGTKTLATAGVEVGQQYALVGTKNPAASFYRGPQEGNSVCTLSHGG